MKHACRLRLGKSRAHVQSVSFILRTRRTSGRASWRKTGICCEQNGTPRRKTQGIDHRLSICWSTMGKKIAKNLPGHTGFDCGRDFWTRCAERLRLKKTRIVWTQKEKGNSLFLSTARSVVAGMKSRSIYQAVRQMLVVYSFTPIVAKKMAVEAQLRTFGKTIKKNSEWVLL